MTEAAGKMNIGNRRDKRCIVRPAAQACKSGALGALIPRRNEEIS
jgi:hypothetical protein